ncbi:hypothetical protein EVAR_94512_1 [Eumeta japonica]|uniref:Pre-C2HC domain-containing protein n=1 Tax=Eumeta variegata TaxID=151549 RepID=A0A4C1UWN9_EUMVA|nr:hypothetical protein EVAR_94512_1 [Eumeta japonica]
MMGSPPGPTTGQDSKRLPLEELKSLFFSFLVQQGYAVPEEAKDFFYNKPSMCSRDSLPYPSTCSSKRFSSALSFDEASEQSRETIKVSNQEVIETFQTIHRKPCKSARRHKLTKTDTTDSFRMRLDNNPALSTIDTDSSASALQSGREATVAEMTAKAPSNSIKKFGTMPKAPPRVKPPPSIILRDKTKWNAVSRECSRLHINYAKAQIPSTEERKIKTVINGVPIEIEIDEVKADLVYQSYPVLTVHRMHCRDSTALGMTLIILKGTDIAKDIFKNLFKVWRLSGIYAEAPYKRGMPGQYHRCQLYRHAALNCHPQPRCIKFPVTHWTKQRNRIKSQVMNPYSVIAVKIIPQIMAGARERSNLVQLKGFNKASIVKNKPAGEDADFEPAPPPKVNLWFRSQQTKVALLTKATNRRELVETPLGLPSSVSRNASTAASALGKDISTIMSILRTVAENSSKTVPAKSNRKELPRDVIQIDKGYECYFASSGNMFQVVWGIYDLEHISEHRCSVLSAKHSVLCSKSYGEYTTWNMLAGWKRRLQRAIDELTQWLRLWRIDVNPDKSASIYFNYSTCKDIDLPTLSKFMKYASERFFDVASSHSNPLLVSAVTYEPPPPHHFCRRARNVLLNPPDDLTVEAIVEKIRGAGLRSGGEIAVTSVGIWTLNLNLNPAAGALRADNDCCRHRAEAVRGRRLNAPREDSGLVFRFEPHALGARPSSPRSLLPRWPCIKFDSKAIVPVFISLTLNESTEDAGLR